MRSKFSILITTKNRLEELKFTLLQIQSLMQLENVAYMICDDGSSDGTYDFIKANYPEIQLVRNEKSKGLIFSRNGLLALTTTSYAISLDDDAHFLSENILENINDFFIKNPKCGVGSFRIFWGVDKPFSYETSDKTERVKGFVGCGHVWNMKACSNIPNYPDWFVFYGEEEFASFQLFKKGWEIHYLPEVIVHHRVDVKSRKKERDYRLRLRRSLRAGWYLYFLFYPWKVIPKKFIYTLWMQFKLKVFKGDFKALIAIVQALGDVIINIPNLIKYSNRLTTKEYKEYCKLADTKLYWKPEFDNE